MMRVVAAGAGREPEGGCPSAGLLATCPRPVIYSVITAPRPTGFAGLLVEPSTAFCAATLPMPLAFVVKNPGLAFVIWNEPTARTAPVDAWLTMKFAVPEIGASYGTWNEIDP